MVKIILPIIILLSGVFALHKFSCSSAALSPKIKAVKQVQIDSITNEHIKLNITVTTKNRNNFSVSVKNILVFVIYNGDTLGIAKFGGPITLPSDAETDINLNTDFRTSKLVSVLQDNTDSIKLSLKGNLNAEVAFMNIPVNVEVPFIFSLKNDIYKIIENDSQKEKLISIQNAALQNLDINESSVKIDFLLKNPYGVSFILQKYPSKIYINGKYSGDGDVADSIAIAPLSNSERGSFQFKLNNFSTAASFLGTLFSRKIEYETRGILYLKILNYEIKFPYNFKGVLIQL